MSPPSDRPFIPLRRTYAGALFLVISNGITTTIDAIAKDLTARLHEVQIVWGYFFVIAALTCGYAVMRPGSLRSALATRRLCLQCGRGAILSLTITMLFIALASLPLAEAIAIAFTAPLFIILLAAPLLGERVGVHRLVAVVIGFTGAVIVIRPGTDMLEWAALFALASALCFALFQLMTRMLATTERPFTTLLYTGLSGLACSSLTVPFFWMPMATFDLMIFAIIGGLGVAAHVCMIRAYAFSQASLIAPFNYTKLIWAVALGYLFFGEILQPHVIIGSTIIVASGLYALYQERMSD